MKLEVDKPYFLFPYKKSLRSFHSLKNGKIYYLKKSYDIHNHQWSDENIFDLLRKLDFEKKDFRVTHLAYELGFIFQNIEFLQEDMPLAVDLVFEKCSAVNLKRSRNYINGTLDLVSKPIFSEYESSFIDGQKHLKCGDSYQFNLTSPYKFKLKKVSARHIPFQLWSNPDNRGQYGHFTFLGNDQFSIFSNTPECLFQAKFSEDMINICSMPIKGTVSCLSDDDVSSSWKILKSSMKNQSELYMITDLIRNDLSSIHLPIAEVRKKKSLLRVPNLVHQYSVIDINLRKNDVSLFKILKSMFPGGSVTGAPKKRTMEILKKIETGPRGFYCGSTIINAPNYLAATINIRTAIIESDNSVFYHAGGGITVQSSLVDEFEEMRSKVQSFAGLF